MRLKIYHVILGRFAPIHKGHQMLIEKMISKFQIENCLIIIGSSTTLNNRTPYTFKTRKEMIHILYPKLKIIGLPDTNPILEIFEDKDMDIWLKNIKNIEKKLNAKFIFYGGSKKDIEYLESHFETNVLVKRKSQGLNISATEIRNIIKSNNHKLLKSFIDPRVYPISVEACAQY